MLCQRRDPRRWIERPGNVQVRHPTTRIGSAAAGRLGSAKVVCVPSGDHGTKAEHRPRTAVGNRLLGLRLSVLGILLCRPFTARRRGG